MLQTHSTQGTVQAVICQLHTEYLDWIEGWISVAHYCPHIFLPAWHFGLFPQVLLLFVIAEIGPCDWPINLPQTPQLPQAVLVPPSLWTQVGSRLQRSDSFLFAWQWQTIYISGIFEEQILKRIKRLHDTNRDLLLGDWFCNRRHLLLVHGREVGLSAFPCAV